MMNNLVKPSKESENRHEEWVDKMYEQIDQTESEEKPKKRKLKWFRF